MLTFVAMRNLLLLCLFVLIWGLANAAPKYEFRGAWIATIGGIDWPNPKLRGNTYLVQQEFINLLNELERDGINAIIVQIRPAADAFYESSYEPWSKYLTGTQGAPPEPFYDALTFMTAEAHHRGMEFHAWFNPYRALVDAYKNPNPKQHVTYTHPEWFVNYGGKKYFNPGLPQVQAYVSKVVCEVVQKYDIDAVHFDDYFYPYRIAGKEFPDQAAFNTYGGSFATKGDWRRNNVNSFVRDLSKAIKQIKPFVKFGISPFGVWRNASQDPDGSPTEGGQTNYDDLYADVLLWTKSKWIDYVLPQLYWEQSHRKVGFTTLLDWWGTHNYGRALYAGHGLYRVANDKASAWQMPAELEQQVYAVRGNANAQGSCFYSANYFYKDRLGVISTMRNTYYKEKAIVPAMPWIDNVAPNPPKQIGSCKVNNGFLEISAQHSSADSKYFALYKIPQQQKIDLGNSSYFVKYTDQGNMSIPYTSGCKYLLTSCDRLHNESQYIEVK
jgi:uncharacterized lipoprotein YddW (UPF0748 family)